MLSTDPEGVLDRLRGVCLTLPEAAEKVSHGAPAFHVAGKMFAYFRHDHHGDGKTVVCLKVPGRDEQEMLLEAEPELFSWPAYLGGDGGWISMSLAEPATDWGHVAARVAISHGLAAPTRLKPQL